MARPKPKRRKKNARLQRLDSGEILSLLTTNSWDFLNRWTETDRKAAWFMHREVLLAYWTQDPEDFDLEPLLSIYRSTINGGPKPIYGMPGDMPLPKPGGPGTFPAAWHDFEGD